MKFISLVQNFNRGKYIKNIHNSIAIQLKTVKYKKTALLLIYSLSARNKKPAHFLVPALMRATQPVLAQPSACHMCACARLLLARPDRGHEKGQPGLAGVGFAPRDDGRLSVSFGRTKTAAASTPETLASFRLLRHSLLSYSLLCSPRGGGHGESSRRAALNGETTAIWRSSGVATGAAVRALAGAHTHPRVNAPPLRVLVTVPDFFTRRRAGGGHGDDESQVRTQILHRASVYLIRSRVMV